MFAGTVDDITVLITSNNHMADDINTLVFHGNRVRLKVSPDTSCNYVAYIVDKFMAGPRTSHNQHPS